MILVLIIIPLIKSDILEIHKYLMKKNNMV